MLTSTSKAQPILCFCLPTIVALALGAARPASAGPYTVSTVIASNAGQGFFSAPSINDNGDVAAFGNPGLSLATYGAYLQSGGVTTLSLPGSAFPGFAGPLSLNNGKRIAFHDGSIRTALGANVTTVYSPPIGVLQGVNHPTLSDDGSVVFSERSNSTSIVTVWLHDGVQMQPIVTSSTAPVLQLYFGFNGPGQVPTMSPNGTVAYAWIGDDGVTPQIQTYHDGVITPVADLDPAITTGYPFHFSVNDSGAVAFYGKLLGQAPGVYVADGVSVAPVTLPGGFAANPLGLNGPVAFNNHGEIIFTGFNSHTMTGGIWTTGAADEAIVEIGDPLDGSTIQSISFGPEGLNDLGQIAFAATLADGRSGVFVLTPVPEPSTIVLLAAGVAVLAACRLRRRRP